MYGGGTGSLLGGITGEFSKEKREDSLKDDSLDETSCWFLILPLSFALSIL